LTGADRKAGYRYEISILPAEFSWTQVLDRPVSGRVFFEEVIGENRDIGRPSQVQLIFDRQVSRRTPGRFRPRVITAGLVPCLHIAYKNTRSKPYQQEGRALRTETTSNNPRDVSIGKRLKNRPALRQIGFRANRPLLDVQNISYDCSIAEAAFQRVGQPIEARWPARFRAPFRRPPRASPFRCTRRLQSPAFTGSLMLKCAPCWRNG
jgi:hypothetical protein